VDIGPLLDQNTILGGDLNFTLALSELWGTHRVDPLLYDFSRVFQDVGMIDMCPEPVGPTWRNARSSCDGIAKILD